MRFWTCTLAQAFQWVSSHSYGRSGYSMVPRPIGPAWLQVLFYSRRYLELRLHHLWNIGPKTTFPRKLNPRPDLEDMLIYWLSHIRWHHFSVVLSVEIHDKRNKDTAQLQSHKLPQRHPFWICRPSIKDHHLQSQQTTQNWLNPQPWHSESLLQTVINRHL